MFFHIRYFVLLLSRKKLGKAEQLWYNRLYGIYRLEESRERGTQGDTQAGRTAQEIGKNGKGDRGINRRTPESRERNMDSVSTRGRSLPGAKKVWSEAWEPHGSQQGRTGKYPDSGGGENTGGLRDHRQAVDVRTDT